MGSKNLKAVVVAGSGMVEVADPAGFKETVLKACHKIQAHPVGGQGLKAYGTDVLVNILNEIGALPTRNYRDGYFPTADKVGGESLSKNNLLRSKGCFSCIISCGRISRVTDPKFAGEGEGPEYETAWGSALTAEWITWVRSSRPTISVMKWGWTRSPWDLPSPVLWTCLKTGF